MTSEWIASVITEQEAFEVMGVDLTPAMQRLAGQGVSDEVIGKRRIHAVMEVLWQEEGLNRKAAVDKAALSKQVLENVVLGRFDTPSGLSIQDAARRAVRERPVFWQQFQSGLGRREYQEDVVQFMNDSLKLLKVEE